MDQGCLRPWVGALICAAGFVGVFVGAALHERLARKKTPQGLTDFQAYLFGTGFVYAAAVVVMMALFLWDHYRGTALQGFLLKPTGREVFLRIFGAGNPGEAQYPLLALDLGLIDMVFGAMLGGFALLLWRKLRRKARGDAENALLYGYSFPRKRPLDYLKTELRTLRRQVPLPEYLLWWAMRAGLVYFAVTRWEDAALRLIFIANLCASFTIPLVRFLFFPKLFFGRINYRVQTLLNVFTFCGNFLGHGLNVYGKIPEYDKLLHFLSGGLVVFIGCVLIEGLRRGKALPRLTKVLASFGFSCLVMICWEIFEFCTDFFMQNTANQNWTYNPSPDMLFFRLFGQGAPLPEASAVLDTNVDVIFALVGAVLCAAALYGLLVLSDRRAAKREAEKPAQADMEASASA